MSSLSSIKSLLGFLAVNVAVSEKNIKVTAILNAAYCFFVSGKQHESFCFTPKCLVNLQVSQGHTHPFMHNFVLLQLLSTCCHLIYEKNNFLNLGNHEKSGQGFPKSSFMLTVYERGVNCDTYL